MGKRGQLTKSLMLAATFAFGVSGAFINIEHPADSVAAHAKSSNAGGNGNGNGPSSNNAGGNGKGPGSNNAGGNGKGNGSGSNNAGGNGTGGEGSDAGGNGNGGEGSNAGGNGNGGEGSNAGNGNGQGGTHSGGTNTGSKAASFGKLNAILHMSDRAKEKNGLYQRVKEVMLGLTADQLAEEDLPTNGDELNTLQSAFKGTLNKPLTEDAWDALREEFVTSADQAEPDDGAETPAP